MLIRFFYTLILAFVAPLLLFGLYKSKPNKPKFGKRWKEHFGVTPQLISNQQRPIWIHAVSVGESIAATPLIKEIKKRNPEQSIVVTTTTSTGAEQIEKLGDLVEHRYMPIDFAFAVKGFLRVIQPKKMLIIETELWPNTLKVVHDANVPIYVVNARLSEKSQANYRKVLPLFRIIATCITKVLCQHQSDADRFESLGMDKEKLCVTGSIKFDIEISDSIRTSGQKLRNSLGSERPVWIAASTHKGEDELILNAHKEVLKQYPSTVLILVPRHPERFDEVYALTKEANLTITRRTDPISSIPTAQVYLGDTMGEMLILMAASDIVFMGGSLLGDKVGGHNVLEPIALNLPVLTGPSYYNFQEIVDELVEQERVYVCSSGEIGKSINNYLGTPKAPSKQTKNVQTKSIGPIGKTIEYIMNYNSNI